MKPEIKKRAIQRLKIIAGQIRGLQGMIEEEKYCIDIINQAEAVKKALSGVEDLILRNHLSTHLAHQMKHGEEDKAMKEMMTVYNLVGRK